MAGNSGANAAKRADELLKRFDKNGDGKLDDDERADAKEAMLKEQTDRQMARSAAGQMRSELLRRFDRNADGKIDDREMAELEKFVRPRVESNPAQLRRYDTNHDGKIDDTEWLAARVAIAQWLNAAGPAALENESPGNGDAEKNPRMDAARERQTKIAPVSRQSPADDHARLQAVADELARRRAMREAATETSK